MSEPTAVNADQIAGALNVLGFSKLVEPTETIQDDQRLLHLASALAGIADTLQRSVEDTAFGLADPGDKDRLLEESRRQELRAAGLLGSDRSATDVADMLTGRIGWIIHTMVVGIAQQMPAGTKTDPALVAASQALLAAHHLCGRIAGTQDADTAILAARETIGHADMILRELSPGTSPN